MVVTTGFFDGVHLGHRQVIEKLVSVAHERDTESVVVSFWPHPRTVLQDGARSLRLLTTLDEKRHMLLEMGVDRVEVLNFTKEFSSMSASQYLQDYVINELGCDAIVLGYDNRIGSKASGSGDSLPDIAGSLGLEGIRTGALDISGGPVSSTRIREALCRGDVSAASELLGYDYSIKGVVVSGNRIGHTIGFPTANMQLYEPLKAVPGNGVYMTEVSVQGRSLHGITNIGVRPTLGRDSSPVIETHILGFDEEIYGLDIRLSFVRKIRDEIKFKSLDLLRQQLHKDMQVW